jgi:hypothetical protein
MFATALPVSCFIQAATASLGLIGAGTNNAHILWACFAICLATTRKDLSLLFCDSKAESRLPERLLE